MCETRRGLDLGLYSVLFTELLNIVIFSSFSVVKYTAIGKNWLAIYRYIYDLD